MAENNRRLAVLYGSQTGCAEAVAEAVARQGCRRAFSASAISLESYSKMDLPNESLVVFVVSTTGDGEVPDPMKPFWKFLLRKALPRDSLTGVRFAVFGLGDSTYVKFNAVARKLRARLLQLGATEVHKIGLGDDMTEPYGLESDVDRWLASLWSALLQLHPLPPGFVVDEEKFGRWGY